MIEHSSLRRSLLAGYPEVFADPALSRLFAVMLLAGTASGMAISYTAIWASETFGAGPQAVALLFAVSGIAGAVGNPLLGHLSDRLGRRRPFVVGQLLAAGLAFVGYTLARSYVAGMVLVVFAGFGVMGLVLATVNDVVQSRPGPVAGGALRILAAERTAWSVGIILGPAAAAALVTIAADVRVVFIAGAAMSALAAIAAWSSVDPPRRAPSSTPRGQDWPRPRRIALVVLIVGLVLLAVPAQTRTMYLPLFVTRVLGQPMGTVGPAFTLNAITAVLAMPYMGALSGRIGAQRVLYVGAGVGFVYCVLQSLATNYTATLAIQVLIGLHIALWSTASLVYVQGLMPNQAGVAGGLYLTVQQLAPVISGLALGPVAEQLGVPAAFQVTAILVVFSFGIIFTAHRLLGREQPA